jgi:hypothetical protein
MLIIFKFYAIGFGNVKTKGGAGALAGACNLNKMFRKLDFSAARQLILFGIETPSQPEF